jgi:hypothetical protein
VLYNGWGVGKSRDKQVKNVLTKEAMNGLLKSPGACSTIIHRLEKICLDTMGLEKIRETPATSIKVQNFGIPLDDKDPQSRG